MEESLSKKVLYVQNVVTLNFYVHVLKFQCYTNHEEPYLKCNTAHIGDVWLLRSHSFYWFTLHLRVISKHETLGCDIWRGIRGVGVNHSFYWFTLHLRVISKHETLGCDIWRGIRGVGVSLCRLGC